MPGEIPELPTLFVLGVDHRVNLAADVLSEKRRRPNAAVRERVAALKQLVFEGMKTAIEDGVAKSQAAIWSDADLGEAVVLRSRAMSLATAISVERPRYAEFRFEDTQGYEQRLQRLGATYAAARIGYNAGGDADSNALQRRRLRTLSETCRSSGIGLLLELAIQPTSEQLKTAGGYAEWHDKVRPALAIQTVRELQDSGVEPAVWVVDPGRSQEVAATVAAQAHLDDRSAISVLFSIEHHDLDDEASTGRAVSMAARTPGVNGLLVGPEAYLKELALYHEGELGREDAAAAIGDRYRRVCELFIEARRKSRVS